MTEQEWLECDDPRQMLALLDGKASDRKLRLFAVECFRRAPLSLTRIRSRKAVEILEGMAEGRATVKEMEGTFLPEVDNFACVDGDFNLCRYFLVEPVLQVAFNAWSITRGDFPRGEMTNTLRDIFGPALFRPVTVDPTWRTPTVVSLAFAIYDDRAFDRLPILADALEDAGCANADILNHCRQPGEHVRGCWCLDLALDKK